MTPFDTNSWIAAVAHRDEHQLALLAQQHDATCDRDSYLGLRAGLEMLVGRSDLAERVGAVEAVGVRVGASLADPLDLRCSLGLLGEQAAAVLVQGDVAVVGRGR
jgi:hypothetical protein